MYFGASTMSFPIESQNSAIGFTAFSVISLAHNAAITAIQSIISARNDIITLVIIHCHAANVFQKTHEEVCHSVYFQIIFNSISPFHCQNFID